MQNFTERIAEGLSHYGRSTVMRDLAWLVALLVFGTIASARYDGPRWFTFAIGCLALVSVVTYILLYIYFAFTDKDCLRSENYSIRKMAIEHGLLGDDKAGLIKVTAEEILSADPNSKNEQDNKALS